MDDPEALKQAVAKRLRKNRLPVIPLIVGGIILFNIVSASFASGQWPVAFFALLLFWFWLSKAVLPKLKRTLREVAEEAKAAGATSTRQTQSNSTATYETALRQNPTRDTRRESPKSKRKLCKSCNIRHSPDTRYCRRCGAPLLR
ncbi:MAG: hypothetical protein AAF265_15295 [Pseudomonadota bacterium]